MCISTFSFFLSCRLCRPDIDSMAVIDVLRIPPVMIRKPIFWTFSRRCVFVLAAVAKVGDPYSITGRTLPLYTCLRVLTSAPQVVSASFFVIPNLRSAFSCVFSM